MFNLHKSKKICGEEPSLAWKFTGQTHYIDWMAWIIIIIIIPFNLLNCFFPQKNSVKQTKSHRDMHFPMDKFNFCLPIKHVPSFFGFLQYSLLACMMNREKETYRLVHQNLLEN